MTYILGADNVCSTDLGQLEGRFGMAPVYGKRLVAVPDQSYMKIPELVKFKLLTGEDSFAVERKGKDPFQYKFRGLCWFVMNELPLFGGDTGRHVFERMILFQTPEGIPESKQDGEIMEKLEAEAPYIVPQILAYLPSVVENNKFNLPHGMDDARATYALQNDPVRAWVDECLIDTQNPRTEDEQAAVDAWRKSGSKPTVSQLYAAYKAWCEKYENGRSLTRAKWNKHMREICGANTEFTTHSRSGSVMTRFCLNSEAYSEYYNGPRDSDQGSKKEREHGMMQKR